MRNFLLYTGDIVGSRESHPFLFSGLSSHSCFQAMVWKKHILKKIGNVCYPPITGYPCTVIMITTKTHLQPFSVCAFAEAAVGKPPVPPRWLWPTLPVKYLEAVTDFQNKKAIPSYTIYYWLLLQQGVHGYLFKLSDKIISINSSDPFELL